jgi:hypothetical protein
MTDFVLVTVFAGDLTLLSVNPRTVHIEFVATNPSSMAGSDATSKTASYQSLQPSNCWVFGKEIVAKLSENIGPLTMRLDLRWFLAVSSVQQVEQEPGSRVWR